MASTIGATFMKFGRAPTMFSTLIKLAVFSPTSFRRAPPLIVQKCRQQNRLRIWTLQLDHPTVHHALGGVYGGTRRKTVALAQPQLFGMDPQPIRPAHELGWLLFPEG